MTTAYPLAWPSGWPRTAPHKREASRFKPAGLAAEAEQTIAEIKMLGGQSPVISTNIELRRDGLPYSGRKAPEDPGVAVYFYKGGKQQCIPCDRWRTVEENLRAVWKSIEAMRGLDRWGAKSFVDAAFAGFVALPSNTRHWSEVLGVKLNASQDEIDAAYRSRARHAHPDAGGSTAAMSELNAARDAAKRGATP